MKRLAPSSPVPILNPRPVDSMQGITILGSTGSIGVNTLKVIALHPQRYRVVALTANTQVERLFAQCLQFQPKFAVMLDAVAAQQLQALVLEAGLATEVLAGIDGLNRVAALTQVQIVMAAIVGAAGLLPTLSAIRAGKRVLLANKEPLVISGALCLQEARKSGAELLPIDSEHNAVFQCMPAGYATGVTPVGVRKIQLTCSGGPFRTTAPAALADVTPEQACAHPNWVMGRKISVDSATLMNKGLEVIEACRLFDLTPDRVEVVIHPQSVIHSLVEYDDGSVLAQMGNPDMRTPIAHALAWPQRIASGVKSLDLSALARLDFAAPDFTRFPCLRLAYDAAHTGGTAPAVLNAANEIAVAAFLHGRIGFLQIAQTIEHTLAHVVIEHDMQLEAVLAQDAVARGVASDFIGTHGRR